MPREAARKLDPEAELKQLEKRQEELRSQLRADREAALRHALEGFNNLNLGVRYELREASPAPNRKARSRTTVSRKGAVSPQKPCPVCGFQTDPPHDARRHRGQSRKRAFTAKELAAMDMVKV